MLSLLLENTTQDLVMLVYLHIPTMTTVSLNLGTTNRHNSLLEDALYACALSCLVMSDSLRPQDCSSPRRTLGDKLFILVIVHNYEYMCSVISQKVKLLDQNMCMF